MAAKSDRNATDPKSKSKGRRVPTGADRLTGKQRMFVAYYLGESKCNAADAARRAGYARPTDVGGRLVRKSAVAAAIAASVGQVGLTADEVLALLSDHATASIEDFVRVTKRGVTLDFAKAKALGRLKCVRKLKRGKFGWEVELYDAQAAADKLAKFRRLYGDETSRQNVVTTDVVELASRAAAALKARRQAESQEPQP